MSIFLSYCLKVGPAAYRRKLGKISPCQPWEALRGTQPSSTSTSTLTSP